MKKHITALMFLTFHCFIVNAQYETDNIYYGFTGTGVILIDAVTTKNGDLYLLFDNGTISIRKLSEKTWKTYNTELTINSGMRNRICYDSVENVIWAVGLRKNIKIDINTDTFSVINKLTNQHIPNEVNYVTYANGGVWFVSPESLVFYKQGIWQTFPSVYDKINPVHISAFAGNGTDLFWIATTNNGLFEYKNGLFQNQYNDSTTSNPVSIVFDIAYSKGSLWMFCGGIYHSIHILNNGNIHPYTGHSPGLRQGNFYASKFISTKLFNTNNTVYLSAGWGIESHNPYIEWSKLEQGKPWNYIHLNSGSNGIKIILPLFDHSLYVLTNVNISTSPIVSRSKTTDLPRAPYNSANIDINYVDAPMRANGGLFNYDDNLMRYGTDMLKVPKFDYLKTVYSAGLWQTGEIVNTVAAAIQTYAEENNYEPGPINLQTEQRDTNLINKYNKVWKVDRAEILAFNENFKNGNVANGSYTIPESIMQWPAMGDIAKGEPRYIAPFIDENNDGVYNPMQGDYPKIKGDQALFLVMNDLKPRNNPDEKPLLTEVRLIAYAYTCNRLLPSQLQDVMNYTVFYEYTIINRNPNPISDYRFGFWTDFELGNNSDDYVGCNPKEHYAFAYNGKDFDEGPDGYGENPPAIATILVDSLKVKSTQASSGMTNCMMYLNDFSLNGNPSTAFHFSSYMHSKWKDTSPLWYQNRINDTALHIYPFNDDLKGRGHWSMDSVSFIPNDKRMIMASGGHTLSSFDTATATIALVYARAKSGGRMASLYKLRQGVRAIQQMYNVDSFPSCYELMIGLSKNNTTFKPQLWVYPNPASTYLYLNLNQHSGKEAQVACYDILGKHQFSLLISIGKMIDISQLQAGVYLLRVSEGDVFYTSKFVKE